MFSKYHCTDVHELQQAADLADVISRSERTSFWDVICNAPNPPKAASIAPYTTYSTSLSLLEHSLAEPMLGNRIQGVSRGLAQELEACTPLLLHEADEAPVPTMLDYVPEIS
jgi:hypothetical protein